MTFLLIWLKVLGVVSGLIIGIATILAIVIIPIQFFEDCFEGDDAPFFATIAWCIFLATFGASILIYFDPLR